MSRFIELNYAVINSDDISSIVRLGGSCNGREFEGVKIKFKDGKEVYVRANKEDTEQFIESLNYSNNGLKSIINWKPIELLTEDWLITQEEILLFDSYTHVGSVTKQGFYGNVCVNTGDFENDEYFNDIKNRYTYFAKIIPPRG